MIRLKLFQFGLQFLDRIRVIAADGGIAGSSFGTSGIVTGLFVSLHRLAHIAVDLVQVTPVTLFAVMTNKDRLTRGNVIHDGTCCIVSRSTFGLCSGGTGFQTIYETAGVYINKELKRCDKSSLDDLKRRGRSTALFAFPERKQGAKTSLVLKDPKTSSSVRTVFLPGTVSSALHEMKLSQDSDRELLGAAYLDYNMVLAHQDGRPYEEHQIADKLRRLIQANDLPPVVFHSLRHCSTSVKLQISGGNIKAVQGDTGHAQARMVTDLYAHTNTEDRRRLAQRMEQDFFKGGKQPTTDDKTSPDETTEALRLLQENPDMAKLIIAALGRFAGN